MGPCPLGSSDKLAAVHMGFAGGVICGRAKFKGPHSGLQHLDLKFETCKTLPWLFLNCLQHPTYTTLDLHIAQSGPSKPISGRSPNWYYFTYLESSRIRIAL